MLATDNVRVANRLAGYVKRLEERVPLSLNSIYPALLSCFFFYTKVGPWFILRSDAAQSYDS